MAAGVSARVWILLFAFAEPVAGSTTPRPPPAPVQASVSDQLPSYEPGVLQLGCGDRFRSGEYRGSDQKILALTKAAVPAKQISVIKFTADLSYFRDSIHWQQVEKQLWYRSTASFLDMGVSQGYVFCVEDDEGNVAKIEDHYRAFASCPGQCLIWGPFDGTNERIGAAEKALIASKTAAVFWSEAYLWYYLDPYFKEGVQLAVTPSLINPSWLEPLMPKPARLSNDARRAGNGQFYFMQPKQNRYNFALDRLYAKGARTVMAYSPEGFDLAFCKGGLQYARKIGMTTLADEPIVYMLNDIFDALGRTDRGADVYLVSGPSAAFLWTLIIRISNDDYPPAIVYNRDETDLLHLNFGSATFSHVDLLEVSPLEDWMKVLTGPGSNLPSIGRWEVYTRNNDAVEYPTNMLVLRAMATFEISRAIFAHVMDTKNATQLGAFMNVTRFQTLEGFVQFEQGEAVTIGGSAVQRLPVPVWENGQLYRLKCDPRLRDQKNYTMERYVALASRMVSSGAQPDWRMFFIDEEVTPTFDPLITDLQYPAPSWETRELSIHPCPPGCVYSGTTCEPCPKGTVRGPRFVSCIPCDPGRFASFTGMTECISCGGLPCENPAVAPVAAPGSWLFDQNGVESIAYETRQTEFCAAIGIGIDRQPAPFRVSQRCLNQFSCLGNNTCTDHHHGFMCTQCDVGYTRYHINAWTYSCRECPASSVVMFRIAATYMAYMILSICMYYVSVRASRRSTTLSAFIFSELLQHFQIQGLMFSKQSAVDSQYVEHYQWNWWDGPMMAGTLLVHPMMASGGDCLFDIEYGGDENAFQIIEKLQAVLVIFGLAFSGMLPILVTCSLRCSSVCGRRQKKIMRKSSANQRGHSDDAHGFDLQTGPGKKFAMQLSHLAERRLRRSVTGLMICWLLLDLPMIFSAVLLKYGCRNLEDRVSRHLWMPHLSCPLAQGTLTAVGGLCMALSGLLILVAVRWKEQWKRMQTALYGMGFRLLTVGYQDHSSHWGLVKLAYILLISCCTFLPVPESGIAMIFFPLIYAIITPMAKPFVHFDRQSPLWIHTTSVLATLSSVLVVNVSSYVATQTDSLLTDAETVRQIFIRINQFSAVCHYIFIYVCFEAFVYNEFLIPALGKINAGCHLMRWKRLLVSVLAYRFGLNYLIVFQDDEGIKLDLRLLNIRERQFVSLSLKESMRHFIHVLGMCQVHMVSAVLLESCVRSGQRHVAQISKMLSYTKHGKPISKWRKGRFGRATKAGSFHSLSRDEETDQISKARKLVLVDDMYYMCAEINVEIQERRPDVLRCSALNEANIKSREGDRVRPPLTRLGTVEASIRSRRGPTLFGSESLATNLAIPEDHFDEEGEAEREMERAAKAEEEEQNRIDEARQALIDSIERKKAELVSLRYLQASQGFKKTLGNLGMKATDERLAKMASEGFGHEVASESDLKELGFMPAEEQMRQRQQRQQRQQQQQQQQQTPQQTRPQQQPQPTSFDEEEIELCLPGGEELTRSHVAPQDPGRPSSSNGTAGSAVLRRTTAEGTTQAPTPPKKAEKIDTSEWDVPLRMRGDSGKQAPAAPAKNSGRIDTSDWDVPLRMRGDSAKQAPATPAKNNDRIDTSEWDVPLRMREQGAPQASSPPEKNSDRVDTSGWDLPLRMRT